MKRLFWDVETEALPLDQLKKVMPEFTAKANLTDPKKIEADIAEKKADWIDKAALKAITGRIVAVTMAKDDGEPLMLAVNDEKALIAACLAEIKDAISVNAQSYAWNGHGFDLPFLCQRAAIYGITAFKDLTQQRGSRFSWNENLIDPRLVWSMYSSDFSGTSLKSVGLALGVGVKDGNGKDFASLLKSDPIAAQNYAKNDVSILREIVFKMGI